MKVRFLAPRPRQCPTHGWWSFISINGCASFLWVVVPVVVVILGVLVCDPLAAFVVRESSSSAFSPGLLMLGWIRVRCINIIRVSERLLPLLIYERANCSVRKECGIAERLWWWHGRQWRFHAAQSKGIWTSGSRWKWGFTWSVKIKMQDTEGT